MTIRHGLAYLSELVHWKGWYASKLPLYLVGVSYAMLRRESPDAVPLADTACLLGFFCLFASFGHIANDYGDLAADRAAGKRRVLASWSKPSALTAVIVSAAATMLVATACFDARTLALTGVAGLLAAMYSLPPARLKERGISGWVAAALAQRTLPLAIAFQALGVWDWAAVALCVLGTLIGLRFIVVHQIIDRRNDLRAGVRTMATAHGEAELVRLANRLFPIETAAACAAVLAMAASLPAVAIVAAGYAGWLGICSRWKPLSPASYGLFDGFYSVLWPVLLAAHLALRDPLYLTVLALAVALQDQRMTAYIQSLVAFRNAQRWAAKPVPNKAARGRRS